MRVVGIGAGGHARVMLETLGLQGQIEVVCLLDARSEMWNTFVGGVLVRGDDTLLESLRAEGIAQAFLGVGSVGRTVARRRIYETARGAGFDFVTTIHPRAIVSPSARIGAGATILAGAILHTDAELGENVLLNTGSIVEHDCVIGDHAHIAPGTRLAGGVQVGAGAHVGLGASVLQAVRIGANAVVGAGAVVLRDVADGAVVVGVPARVRKGGNEP